MFEFRVCQEREVLLFIKIDLNRCGITSGGVRLAVRKIESKLGIADVSMNFNLAKYMQCSGFS